MRKLIAILAIALATGCGASNNQPFTVGTYPTPEDFLARWNTGKGQHLQVKEWQKLDDEILMGHMATGMSLAYNDNNRAYGVIGPPGKEFGMTCGSLFDLFVKSDEDARYLWFYLSENFPGSGIVVAFKDGVEFRLFAAPGNPDATCNVNPAPNRANTNISSGETAAVAYTNASGEASPNPAAQATAVTDALAADAAASASAQTAADAADAGAQEIHSRSFDVAENATELAGSAASSDVSNGVKATLAHDSHSQADNARLLAEAQTRSKFDEYRRRVEAERIQNERRNAEEEIERQEIAWQRKEAEAAFQRQVEHQAKVDEEDAIERQEIARQRKEANAVFQRQVEHRAKLDEEAPIKK